MYINFRQNRNFGLMILIAALFIAVLTSYAVSQNNADRTDLLYQVEC